MNEIEPHSCWKAGSNAPPPSICTRKVTKTAQKEQERAVKAAKVFYIS